ncbi:hypothetical protein JCM6882_001050 [Rhodosporidiobolus microsporus]
MPVDLIRDSTFGLIANYLSSGRLFPYADQRPDYVVPERYLASSSGTSIDSRFPRTFSQAPTVVSTTSPTSPKDTSTLVNEPGVCPELKGDDLEKQANKDASPTPSPPLSEKYRWLVEFDENDPDRPQNWTMRKKVFVGSLISLLTFAVYVGSAVYTSSVPGLMAEFGVGQVTAISGLTLFVAAYGIGPMILAPMQELPSLGRNPVYLVGLALFVIFQIPEILAKNMGTVLVFRFLSGFVGSPALATGGASMADIFPPQHLAVAIGAWAIGAVCGPIAGPVIGGFAAQEMNWRWPFLELLWISGFAFVVLFFLFPETYEDTILLRRAQRLRKLTGNPLLKAPCEVASENKTLGGLLKENVFRAVRISIEPAILVANSYIGIVYAVFYLWFEAFPIVFTEIHHFNLGLSGLPYLGFVVSAAITFTFYVLYQRYHMTARMEKGDTAPEVRLELGLMAAPFIPVALFIFGWTSREDVHWFWPIFGASLYLPGIFLAFQSILMYISLSYPRYAASLLAGNDFFRSTFASVFPLFGTKMYRAMGVGGGSSMLAGVSILMIPLLWAIMHYGPRLRARSNFADV